MISKHGIRIIAALVVLFVSLGFKCGKSGPGGIKVPDGEIYNGVTYERETLMTPAGAKIGWNKSINPAFGPLVDGGLSDLNWIASSPPNNYDVSDMPASRFTVWLFKRSSFCINPAFLVNATGTPYEGSEWDKDPSPNRCLVCAAGMTIFKGYPNPHSPGMVITDDMSIMRTIVRYEGEHGLLFFKDPLRFSQTIYHTDGQGHPILGNGPPEFSALAMKPLPFKDFKFVSIELPIDVKTDAGNLVAKKGDQACVLLVK